MNNSRYHSKKYILYILIALYIAINLTTLTRFPFVHSDESWLSGLSRNIMEKGDYSITETFFDLKERNPHAIKIIFHTIQILFIKIMGYNIFTFRFISFCFGLLTLYFTYKLGKLLFGSCVSALLAMTLLAVDVQFIYASHFARQEIIMLFVLMLGLWYKAKYSEDGSRKHNIVLGVLIGISIGIHPNSFIISLPFGLIYLYEIFILKERKFRSLAVFTAAVACFAALFTALSIYFDPDFITNYSRYGSEFDVFDPITSKLGSIGYFYLKLFYRVSGTYYTPGIRFQFFLFGAALLISLVKLVRNKSNASLNKKVIIVLLAIAAVNTGIILVGRFNQTSIVFIFPLFYILVVHALEGLAPKYRYAIAAILVAVITFFTFSNYIEYKDNSYDRYLNEISQAVKPWDETLGNLNTEYYFENGRLHDYRNLAFLKDKGMSFAEYIRDNNIKYIIISEELELIHKLRPKWDGIYGPTDYYDEMKAFLGSNCTLQHEFTDSFYGIRIVRYMNLKDWKIRIYKVTY
ncbi:MAG TPA: glycosyltransferase family 39 protein [Clostridia bacterium]|nr:glycosyltransferase family 39 protein [Clostridia bacterium]